MSFSEFVNMRVMTRHLALNDVELENMTFGPGLNRDACDLL